VKGEGEVWGAGERGEVFVLIFNVPYSPPPPPTPLLLLTKCTPKLMVDHVREKHLGLPPTPGKADGKLPSGYEGTGFKEVDVVVQGRSFGKFRIPLGNDPEDTKKWLEDRKKR
jgi:hypothetical protein